MHVMEIVCLMVREQPPGLLAQAAAQRSVEEKDRDTSDLVAIRNRECATRQQKMRKYQGTRHFGGTYVIKNMKSTSDNDIIYHKTLTTVDNVSLDLEKKRIKIPKNRRPLSCENAERKSALSVRLILKQFCVEILNAAYNPLMRHVKNILVRATGQDNDESYYFNAMRFFMEFNRNYKFQVKLVSETVSVETFHFVQKYLETWHEMMVTDKRKILVWSSRMHLALKAYKELLYNLMAMDKDSDEGVKSSSKVIKSNIFYVIEYREMLLLLMNTYKKQNFSLQYVRDLVETTHIFLKLISNFGKNKKLIVQKKGNKRKVKKKVEKSQSAVSTEELWPQISSEVLEVLNSPQDMEVVPFDAASDLPLDEQKVEAMKKVQFHLKNGNFQEAVALLQASREVWPENDSFGAQNMTKEEELNCIEEIFKADLNIGLPLVENNEFVEDEEEEEDIYPLPIEERTLDVSDFLKSFASPKVLYIYGLLLKSFETNSAHINHCIVKMMHRVAWDCKLPSLIFQASIFRSFQKIFASSDSRFKELETLAVFIMRKFTEVAETNKKVLMELLFWKSAKDAYDVEEGYGTYQEKSKAAKRMWEEHEEDELRRLHSEYKRVYPDNPGNMVKWITTNLIKDRTEKAVWKKLKELYLESSKPPVKTKWTEYEEDKLKTLYEQYKNDDDPVGKILEVLSNRSRTNLNKTLLRIGMVSDTKELRRKKKATGRKKKNVMEKSDKESNSSSDENSDVEDSVAEGQKQHRATLERPSLWKVSVDLIEAAKNTAYLVNGLEWLSEAMNDNLEDMDDDDSTEVPLLPLTEDTIQAVDHDKFQKFLLALGLFSPFQQQEIYWRFPGEWKTIHYTDRLKLVGIIAKLCDKETIETLDNLKVVISQTFGESIDSEDTSKEESVISEKKVKNKSKRASNKRSNSKELPFLVENKSSDSSENEVSPAKKKLKKVSSAKKKQKKEKGPVLKEVTLLNKQFHSSSESLENINSGNKSDKENTAEEERTERRGIQVKNNLKKEKRIKKFDSSDSEEDTYQVGNSIIFGNHLSTNNENNYENSASQAEVNRRGGNKLNQLDSSASEGEIDSFVNNIVTTDILNTNNYENSTILSGNKRQSKKLNLSNSSSSDTEEESQSSKSNVENSKTHNIKLHNSKKIIDSSNSEDEILNDKISAKASKDNEENFNLIRDSQSSKRKVKNSITEKIKLTNSKKIIDSSDSEDETLNDKINAKPNKNGENFTLESLETSDKYSSIPDDVDEEFESIKRIRTIDSDEELSGTNSHKKKRLVIESDDDD